MNDGIKFLTDEEAREFFDQQARRLMGMGGDEFIRRYDAGWWDETDDWELGQRLMKMVMLRDFWPEEE